jgi:MFS family permease
MNTDIHRMLDEAFAGVEMTADAQDLKEEMRANLVARVAELESSGRAPADAAREAVDELGDVRELLGTGSDTGRDAMTAAYLRHRVRPKPGFVVRTVLLSLVAAGSLALFVLGALEVLALGLPVLLALGAGIAVPLGFVTGDALLQETTTNHPMPPARAAGFGAATFGVLAALALGGVFAGHLDAIALVAVAALLLVASIALFSWLGATKTNRHKSWVRDAHAQMPPNRFEQEPEVAARFGIYTAAIWLVTFGVMVLLIFTVGWWWAPLAFVGGLAFMMLVLGRMMFRA